MNDQLCKMIKYQNHSIITFLMCILSNNIFAEDISNENKTINSDKKVISEIEAIIEKKPIYERTEFINDKNLNTNNDFNNKSNTYNTLARNKFKNTPKETATEHWWYGNHATDDWFGLRSQLEDNGINISGQYTFAYMGNVAGGIKNGAAANDQLQVTLDANLGKLFKNSFLNDTQFSFDFIRTAGPDVQYIIHPFGGSATLAGTDTDPKNAFVIGIEGGLNL